MANDGFWFGTENRMGWIPAPMAGAGSTPSGWGTTGSLLTGGGFAAHSWDTHKEYSFEWNAASSPRVAQLMKSYRDGTYGRGLLYFLDPSTYETNILPARWADPSMALGSESPSLLYGVTATSQITSGGDANMLPVNSARYNVTTAAATTPAADDSLFVPIPEGYTLYLGAFYTFTGTAGIWATPVNANGTNGTAVKLNALGNGSTVMYGNTFGGTIKGVRLWLGRSSTAASTLVIAAMSARLVKTSATAPVVEAATRGPWLGGQGHSGCRFMQPPTYITNSAVSGGRIGFAATFIEVGSWVYG